MPCAEGIGQRFRRGQQRVNSVLILGGMKKYISRFISLHSKVMLQIG